MPETDERAPERRNGQRRHDKRDRESGKYRPDYLPTLAIGGAVVLGGVVLWKVLPAIGAGAATTSAPAAAPDMAETVTQIANPEKAQLEEAILGARVALKGMYDQTSIAELLTRDQLKATENTNAAQRAISANTNAAQVKETTLQTTMAQAIAEAEASAYTTSAQAQAQAEEAAANDQAQTQQQGGLFGFLGNIFSGLLPLFGA